MSAVLKANSKGIRVFATEINPHAARCAKANGVEVIRTDLFRGLKKDGRKPFFDLILFNPPYLPTSEDEKVPGWLNYAFDGGASGRETLDRFFDEVRDYLKPGGKILVLISSITGFEAVKEKMMRSGFEVDIVLRKKVSFEELMVVRGKLS
ncbi:Release factor glutamine methyltransferase [bioreactor metagenome]|uniref:Release factor glutamine methyltransferase n=1 Tax=bioreactor metagenome TaxID=1076179 RepID=A0A645FAK2_9ZZZZ